MEFQRLLYKSVLWRSFYLASQLLLNILIARHYEPVNSGWLFYNLNNYAFVLLLLSLCIESGMGYFLASDRIGSNKLFTLAIVWTGLSAMLAFVFLNFYPYRPPVVASKLFYGVSLSYIIGSMMISFFSALFYAKKDFATPNILLIIINIILIVMIPGNNDGITKWINSSNYLSIFCISFFLQGAMLGIFFKFKYVETLSFNLPSSAEMKMLLQYSLLAFLANLLTFLVFRSDYWFIHFFRRPAGELGNYIQVSKLAQLFFTLPSIFASTVFPLTASGSYKINDDLKILSRLIVFFAGLACLILGLTGLWLFPFVFGEKFDQMYITFLLLIPGIIAICLAYPLAGYFAGKNRIRINICSSVIALLFNISGNIIFIPRYGIRGAAISSSIGYLALCIYLLFIFRKDNPTRIGDFLFPKRSDISWLRILLNNKKSNGAAN